MTPEDPIALVAYLGMQLQLASCLLSLGLGLALRRDAGVRPWFSLWVWSFGAVGLAVGALFVRYFVLPIWSLAPVVEAGAVYGLYAVYLVATVWYFWLLLQGAWRFSRDDRPPSWVRVAVFTAAGVVLLPLALGPSLDLPPLMVPQAAVGVIAFLACAALIHRAPASRAVRASRVLRAIFLALAALWLLYLPAFMGGDGVLEPLFAPLTTYKAYIDTLFQFFLGFGFLLALLDDASRERLEERTARLREVAASEARLAQIVRSASEGIVLLDGERRVAHLNPAALEILECNAADATGQPFDRFLRVPDRVTLWAGLIATRPAPASPVVSRLELTGVRSGGEAFPLEVSLAPLGEGPAEGYVLILHDMTEGTRLRMEREQMETQLAQAARMETIGRMISGVAHELNNPLAAILAFSQDLSSQARSPEDREALTTIVQQAQRCRAIVQDLVTFARSKREEREPIAPAELVARVRSAFERQAAAQGARLVIELAPNLPLLEANPQALEQVLTNLLGNAFQALGGPGEVTLRVEVSSARVVFEVEDTGPGIEPRAMARLFEPFFTTKPPGQGTGLGLSVSQSIVEQHDGSIRAASRRDGAPGARFVVTLPFVDRRTIRRPSPPLTELGPPMPSARPRRVLVVDDEAPIRVAIRRFLERRGWIVDEARDGQEALDLLELDGSGEQARGARYDAVVTDLRMPGVTGIELHDQLAEHAPDVLARLVVISGDTASPEVAEFLLRLHRPLVQKPFDLRTLADLLDEAAPPVEVESA
jgi:two-component system NtrC family sensor kinase